MTNEKPRNISLGNKAYIQFRKEIRKHPRLKIGQSLAELALELETDEEVRMNKRTAHIRVSDETWEKIKKKADNEGTTVSRLIERVLWERAEIE